MNTHAVAPPREPSVTSRLRTPALLANDAPMASAPRSRLAHNWACVGLVLAMSLATVVAQQRVSPTAQSEMEGVIRRFYELRARTLDERGTAQDVTDLMALLADTADYEHPRANVTLTKTQASEGITAHLNEGRNARITIRKIWTGSNVATVELTLQYDVPDTRVTRGVSVFEFTNGKIQRVAEY